MSIWFSRWPFGRLDASSLPTKSYNPRFWTWRGQRLKAMLSGEQERLFQLLEPHLSLVRFQPLP